MDSIPLSEKQYLRELAKKQLEYARLPVMAERKRLWYLHNRLQGERPMVFLEESNIKGELMPPIRCKHPVAAEMERQLCQNIAVYETYDDDRVIPDFYTVDYSIHRNFLGLPPKIIYASDGLGFHIEPQFETLEEGLPLLKPSSYF